MLYYREIKSYNKRQERRNVRKTNINKIWKKRKDIKFIKLSC